jgi:hypothetical protein
MVSAKFPEHLLRLHIPLGMVRPHRQPPEAHRREFLVNRTRFPGHSVRLCGYGHCGKFVLAAEGRGAEGAVLLDQPRGVGAGDEGADRLADVLEGFEDAPRGRVAP